MGFMSLPDKTAHPGKLAWLWAMPNIAIALFILAVGAFLFFYHHQEHDQRRMGLIEDLLWQEQSIRQYLNNTEEALTLLSRDMMQQDPTDRNFHGRAAFLLKIYPEIIDIYWVDEHKKIQWHSDMNIEQTGLSPLTEETFDRARLMNRAVFSPAQSMPSTEPWFELHAPLKKNLDFRGVLVARISLQRILKHMVPWWYAERYQLSIVNGDGQVLASKLDTPISNPEFSYQLSFDPPGYGLLLHATLRKTATDRAPRLLEILIVAVSILVVWSLWALRKHMRHREQAEHALREEYAFRTAMENSMATGMRAVDMEGRITYVNPAFCRMVGWSEAELVGHPPPMPYWPTDEIHAGEVFSAMLNGEAPPEGTERRLRKKNGESMDVLIQSAPLIDAKGRQKGWMSSITDITERKQADELSRRQEEKLHFTARLVTMGEMASSLAHELNQPLTAIASYATGCLNKLQQGERAETILPAMEIINAQSQRAGKIIRNMREFVKKSAPNKAPVLLSDILEQAVAFAEIEAKRQAIDIRLDLEKNLPEVNVDRVMIEQVLLNLIRNSIEAMSDLARKDALLALSARRTADGLVQVCMADRGQGLSEEVARQLYTPFFSTKHDGMGMGLNICRSIIEFHQGRLWHEPIPQGGTRFCFTLPIETRP